MEAGGRSRGRSRPAGKHRLIATAVLEGAFEVGGQRNLPGIGNRRLDVCCLQVHDHHAVDGPLDHLCGQPLHLDLHTRTEASGGSCQGLPETIRAPVQDEELDHSGGVPSLPDETCRPDPGLVDHHEVAGAQKGRQLEKAMVGHVAGVEQA